MSIFNRRNKNKFPTSSEAREKINIAVMNDKRKAEKREQAEKLARELKAQEEVAKAIEDGQFEFMVTIVEQIYKGVNRAIKDNEVSFNIEFGWYTIFGRSDIFNFNKLSQTSVYTLSDYFTSKGFKVKFYNLPYGGSLFSRFDSSGVSVDFSRDWGEGLVPSERVRVLGEYVRGKHKHAN